MKPGAAVFARLPPKRWRWVHRGAPCEAQRVRHSPTARWSTAHQHRHDLREILVVLEGNSVIGVRGMVFRARPGSIFLLDRDEPHDSWYAPQQPDCRHLWFHFSSAHQAVVHEIVCSRGRSLPVKTKRRTVCFRRRMLVAGPFVEAVTESWDRWVEDDSQPSAAAQTKAAVTALLLHTQRLLLEPTKPQHDTVAQKRVVAQIQEYVRKCPGNDLALQTLARMAGYAPSHFHQLFFRHARQRLHQYVNRVRLDHAKKLLAAGRSVRSVAEELRFGTAAYFSRFFKNSTGCAPVRWKG